MLCHIKYFEIINETTTKIHDFILEFYNTKFYFISLVIYVMYFILFHWLCMGWNETY
jgi:hypothetical protein